MALLKALQSSEEYAVAWLAALPIERAAATAMLEELHDEPSNFSQHSSDTNSYTWGRIGKHNVAIASLAAGVFGTTSAATTASGILSSLPHIKFGLLVGIGAGVPNSWQDIRLGDVIVSQPRGNNGGVIQYDFGKASSAGRWERGDFLSKPPEALLKALAKLQSEHELQPSRVPEFIQDAATRNSKFESAYMHPGSQNDRLFQSDYEHLESMSDTYDHCDSSREITRSLRDSNEPEIHYGVIASGNTLVNDVTIRDSKIAEIDRNIICFEMEAAGLMNSFPYIVIRGVSDYADSHKNYSWQRYASATAAAFAKEFLIYVDTADVRKAKEARDTLSEVVHQAHRSEKERKVNKFLRALYTCPYAERKDRNIKRVEGTCEWFVSHPRFRHWQEATHSSLLWVSADPGCGKSVLARYLVDEVLPHPENVVCYFFFKDDFPDQRSSANALCAVLRQLYEYYIGFLDDSVLDKFAVDGDRLIQSFPDLWKILKSIAAQQTSQPILCVIDALDECQDIDRTLLVEAIIGLDFDLSESSSSKLKVLVTSRPYNDIRQRFAKLKLRLPTIHLQGEDEHEVEKISREINIVIQHTVQDIVEEKALEPEECTFLLQQLTSVANRTYLWAYLTLDFIRKTPGFTRGNIRRAATEIPKTVDEAYEKILKRSADPKKANKFLSIIIAAVRPLSLQEMSLAFAINTNHQTFEDLEEELEPDSRFPITARDLCGLFVVIVDSRFYLLHQTAKEFLIGQTPSTGSLHPTHLDVGGYSFQWKNSIDRLRSHRTVTHICLWYLKLYSQENCPSIFLDYSATHWSTHFRDGGIENDEEETVTSARNLCTPKSGIYRIWYDVYAAAVPDCPQASSPLVIASYLGLEPVVRSLSGSKAELEAKDEKHRHTPLALAAREGHLSVAKLLINRGAEIDSKDNTDLTPLAYAVKHQSGYYVARQQEEIAELLLEKGANPNLRSTYGSSILERCVRIGSVPMARLLLENGAEINDAEQSTIFGLESFRGFRSLISSWLYDESSSAIVEYDDSKQSELLSTAVEDGNKPMVELLLEKGANIEISDANGDTPLTTAASKGNLQLMELLLDMGAKIESSGTGGRTPLDSAVKYGKSEALELLLKFGAKFEPGPLCNALGSSLLIYAACGESEAIVKKVLEMGADVNASDLEKKTALHHAVERGSIATIGLLLDWSADPNCEDAETLTPLFLAGKKDNVAAMKLLLQKGAQLDKDVACHNILLRVLYCERWQVADFLLGEGVNLEARDEDGRSLLSWVAAQQARDKHLDKARITWLLEKHMDIDSKDNYGRTPLWWAARSYSYFKFELLLERGANIENIDIYGDTPLAWALKNDENYMAQFLLEKGAKLDCKSVKVIRAPLSIAAQLDNGRVVRELIEAGAAVNSKDALYGRTALGWAARYGSSTAVEALLSKGAAVDSKSKGERTPLLEAAEYSNLEVVELLLSKNADPNVSDKTGRTPLSWAASSILGSESILVLLLEKGANVDIKDNDGCTPLCWVIKVREEAFLRRQQHVRLELLFRWGAKNVCRNNCRQDFLSWVAQYQSTAFYTQLLDFGAVVDTNNEMQGKKGGGRGRRRKTKHRDRKAREAGEGDMAQADQEC